MKTVKLTDAEVRMMMEAVASWAYDLSEVRHAVNEQRIKSVLAKLQYADSE